MSAIKEMLEWALQGEKSAKDTRKLLFHQVEYDSFELASLNREVCIFEEAVEKARSLLAQEEAQLKHTTTAAVESWKAIASHTAQVDKSVECGNPFNGTAIKVDKAEVEPLLAILTKTSGGDVDVVIGRISKKFRADTMEQAEAKARQYLEALPSVKEGVEKGDK